MFVDFRETGRERKKEALMWERNTDWLTHKAPHQGSNTKPRYVTSPGIELPIF